MELLPPGEIVEAHGFLATPGLINTHAHVPMVLFRGLAEDVSVQRWFNDFIWPVESNLTEEDVHWGMLLGLTEMIEAGVTTVADHYFYMDAAARAVDTAGTRALLGWAVFGSQGDDALARTAEFVARWQGGAGGRIRTWLAPHAPYTCDDDFLRAAVAHARQLGVGIHIHAAEDPAQTTSSLAKRGITPIRVLEETGILDGPTLIAHGCGILPADVELLAAYAGHVGVAHCPKTYLKLAAGLTPILPLRAGGRGHRAGHRRGRQQQHAGHLGEPAAHGPDAEVHRQRPRGDDRPPGPGHRLRGQRGSHRHGRSAGQVAPGYLADILLIDLGGAHHQPLHSVTASLVYNVRASDVDTVIVDGRVVMAGRQLRTLDKTAIIAETQARMMRLAQRLPERRIQVYNP